MEKLRMAAAPLRQPGGCRIDLNDMRGFQFTDFVVSMERIYGRFRISNLDFGFLHCCGYKPLSGLRMPIRMGRFVISTDEMARADAF